MRVFDLAKKVGIPSKDLLVLMGTLGINVTNHMSSVSEDDLQKVLKKTQRPGLKPKEKKGKSGKEVITISPPPPIVEKKSRVLIKKKSVVEEPQPILIAPQETHKETEPVLTSAPSSLEEGQTGQEAASLQREEGEAPPLMEKTAVAPSGETQAVQKGPDVKLDGTPTEKKVDKKKLRQDSKKEILNKFIERETKMQKVQWDGAVIPDVDAGAESTAEVRKWQDFKPIHRKDHKKGQRRSQGAPIGITQPRRKVIKLYEGLTVKEFSELTGQKVPTLISKLMEAGKMATINQPIDLIEAAVIAEGFGIKTEFASKQTEEEMLHHPDQDDPSLLQPRPPVITIMGHVDHGKTSLLDAIRLTKVTEGEAGGITQHIGAYTVTVGDKKVTFLDTPGHEAFTAMRARGAKVTDIVVLVVAADDGVMPQTIEAVNHAKAANVPVIVAINKIDKPDANPERVKNALAEFELIPEEWGGKTIFVEVSAIKRLGLEHLLEMILLQADVLELKANPNKMMTGTIVEAKIDRGRGPVATVLVQEGTLKVGDVFITGVHFGKVRALINDQGLKIALAGPSMPVEVIGLEGVPLAGDTFVAVLDERMARDITNSRTERQRMVSLSQYRRATLDDLYQGIKEGIVKELKLVIKADVQGSSEALQSSLEKIISPLVKVVIIHNGVGGITESDVLLASASDAVMIGFNVRPEPKAADLAEREEVDLRLYTVIYDAIADVKAAMEGLLEPTIKERILGRVEVRQVFNISKLGTIAGSYVQDGVVSRNGSARVLRDSVVIYEGKVSSLRRFKDDVKEVQAGYECGIGIEKFGDLKAGDVIEAYTHDKSPTKL